MNVKRKGNRGEYELLHIFLQHGADAERNDQTFIGGGGLPDIWARVNGHEMHIEAKRCERISMGAWLEKLLHDAAPTPFRIPAVVFRKNREPWYITLNLNDFFKMLEGAKNETDNG